MAAKVLILIGSVRAGRLCPEITAWVANIARATAALDFEVVDLADWKLPMDAEPAVPAIGPYVTAVTRAWSEKVAGADAFVFVTPQYNWGYPAVLKNALDHLYREWRGKPAVIVTYGGHGGNKCAAQLRQVLDGLKMVAMPTMPALELNEDIIRGAAFNAGLQFDGHISAVTRAIEELAANLAA